MPDSDPRIVDNSSTDIEFYISPQYVNVSDMISQKAYDYVQTAEASAYNKTMAEITSPKWSFSYEFNGTRIALFGVVIPYISGPLPTAQYSIDGAVHKTSSVQNSTQILTGSNFFTSDWLPLGPHLLTVNVTTATQDAPYLFDYLAIDSTSPPTSATSASQTASPSHTTLPQQDAATKSSTFPIGAVIGGVLGGVILLVAIAFGLWWLWKQNRAYDESSYAYAKTGQFDGDYVQPYVYIPGDTGHTAHSTHDGSHYSDAPLTSAYASLPYNSSHLPSSSQSYIPTPPPVGAKLTKEAHSSPRILSPPQLQPPAPVKGGVSNLSAATSGPPPYAP